MSHSAPVGRRTNTFRKTGVNSAILRQERESRRKYDEIEAALNELSHSVSNENVAKTLASLKSVPLNTQNSGKISEYLERFNKILLDYEIGTETDTGKAGLSRATSAPLARKPSRLSRTTSVAQQRAGAKQAKQVKQK